MSSVGTLSIVAAEQYGCFTRVQAHERGVTDRQLRTLVRDGVLERRTRRVFQFAGAPRIWMQDVMVACLDGGPDCCASHRTAAALHRIDNYPRSGIIEVVVPMDVWHRRADVQVHHTRSLPPADRTVVDGIPVTTVARTLVDLGAVMPATNVEEAFDAAERARVVRRSDVRSRYVALRAPGRNGVGAMTQILSAREDLERLPRSVLERKMKRLLERAGLPAPIARYRTRLNGRTREIDFAYVEARLAIEVDGHAFHGSRRQRRDDNLRADALAEAGWQIRRFTYEQVMHEQQYVADTIRTALRASPNHF